jgi:8-oxo-dGTP pyrophosphatase MutT (NUDIX family)
VEVAPYRPAVRVVCVDGIGRVLLLRWRDPWDGSLLWEPPGGGIEPGETRLQAARRELTEETGLDVGAIVDRPVRVHRDLPWNGQRHVGPEDFFLARYPGQAPVLSHDGLLPDEQVNIVEHAWVPWRELTTLDRLEPPNLVTVLTALEPAGPWAD